MANAPKNFSFNICQESNALVLANSDDLFRILFNLMSNAVEIANRKPGSITSLALHISTANSMVVMRLADDGPGLPAAVRADLFRAPWRPSEASPRHGYGLAIARELAERNGGSLTLARADTGTTFALALPVFTSVFRHDTPPPARCCPSASLAANALRQKQSRGAYMRSSAVADGVSLPSAQETAATSDAEEEIRPRAGRRNRGYHHVI